MFAAEACVPFFSAYGGVVSGSKMWLNHEFKAYDATEGEKLALEKIQDCYREGGFKTKITDPRILVMSSLPLLAHAANFGRLCRSDQCNH